MNVLEPDDFDEALAGLEPGEGFHPPAVDDSFKPYPSLWLFNELNDVYHKPFGRHLDVLPHSDIAGILEEVLGDCKFDSGGQKLVMIGIPRGCYKTTIVAENLPPVVLTKNVNARILIDAFRFDVSQKRVRAARRHIESNKAWRLKYGDDWQPVARELPWSDTAFTVTKRNMPLIEPSVEASGIDRSATGSHYDVIVGDDFVNDVNSRSKDQRDKVYEHITDLYPILAPNGVFVLIFTTWNTDDAYARIQKIDKQRVKEGKAPFWKKIIRSAINPDKSLYAPGILDHEKLADLRDRLGSKKFSAQYLLSPLSDEDRTFNMDIARLVDFNFTPRQFGGTIHIPRWANERLPVLNTLAWDPAGKKYNRRSDFHGITMVGCDPLARWWALEAEALKAKAADVLDRMCKLISFYHPHTVSIEDVGQQTLWLDALRTELDKRNIAFPAFVELSTGNMPKATRIELLQPRWERGEILLRPNQTELITQFDNFTATAEMDHEDILDSLVQHTSTARPATADFMFIRDENPPDQQWLDRRDRLIREGNPNGENRGRLDVLWSAGE